MENVDLFRRHQRYSKPPREFLCLLDFCYLLGYCTDNPEEMIPIAAGNLIHTKLNKNYLPRLFSNYDETQLPEPTDPNGLYKWIATGEGRWGFYRPDELKGFAEPCCLEPIQRVPHECMGISAVTQAALVENGIPARSRFYRSRVREDSDLCVAHWVVEYWNGKEWILKDPSLPERGSTPFDEHYYSWQIYDLAERNDLLLKNMRTDGGVNGTSLFDPKADTMRTMVYDALTLLEGPFTPWHHGKYFGGIAFGGTAPKEPQRWLLDKYGKEFRDALEEPDIEHVRKLVEKHNIRAVRK